MIFYLTFNDAPSGIFSGQVCDVVKFLNISVGTKTKLISFISLRNFFENRSKIKKECGDALVLPMVPGLNRWRWNRFILRIICFLKGPEAIIGRSVLATHLAFMSGVKKVVYDGRGAIAAEWREYKVVEDPLMLSQIEDLEKAAIFKSYFRIAVSQKLIEHWQSKYNYVGNEHVVIPCTLNKVFEDVQVSEQKVIDARKKLELGIKDIVFFYVGSLAGWQSFDLVYTVMKPILMASPINKIVFLSGEDPHIEKLRSSFPEQIFCTSVKPAQVPDYLMAGDYGLLIREQSITNQVASPVKFAEYLACGLNVVISENLGDYSEFVTKQNCGVVLSHGVAASSIDLSKKQNNRMLALNYFTKSSHFVAYKKITEVLLPK